VVTLLNYMNVIHINAAVGAPMPLRPDQEFQEFLHTGRFMLQRGRRSGRYIFYPRAVEPGTGDTDLEWVEASGHGTVYAVTVVRPKPPQPAYNVVLIDLAEGPRMMSRVDGIDPEKVAIGMKVCARIVQEAEGYYVVFEPEQP